MDLLTLRNENVYITSRLVENYNWDVKIHHALDIFISNGNFIIANKCNEKISAGIFSLT